MSESGWTLTKRRAFYGEEVFGEGGLGLVTEAKEKQVQELKGSFERARTAVLLDYRGLNVEQMTDLRRRLQEVGAEFKVVKNTLARRALRDTPLESIDPYIEGPISIALSCEDSPAPAKVIMEYLKVQPLPKVRAGFIQGKVLASEEVKVVAELPPREVLLAQLLAGLEAPVAALPRVLGGVMRKLLFAFQAIAEKKERDP